MKFKDSRYYVSLKDEEDFRRRMDAFKWVVWEIISCFIENNLYFCNPNALS